MQSLNTKFAGLTDKSKSEEDRNKEADRLSAEKQVELLPVAQAIKDLKNKLSKAAPGTTAHDAIKKDLAAETTKKLKVDRELQEIKNAIKKQATLERDIASHESNVGSLNEKLVRLGETKSRIKDRLKKSDKPSGDSKK